MKIPTLHYVLAIVLLVALYIVNSFGSDVLAQQIIFVPFVSSASDESLTGVNEDHTISLGASGQGQVRIIPFKVTYSHGETVTISAEAADGWTFYRWSGDITDSRNITSITVNADLNLVAEFVPAQLRPTVMPTSTPLSTLTFTLTPTLTPIITPTTTPTTLVPTLTSTPTSESTNLSPTSMPGTAVTDTVTPTILPTDTSTPTASPVPTATSTFTPIPTPLPVPGLINGDFETAPHSAWSQTSTSFGSGEGTLIIKIADFQSIVTPRSGQYAAWFGGADSEDASLSQTIRLPSVTPITLSYHYQINAQDECGRDRVSVTVNGTDMVGHDLCRATQTTGWTLGTVDLSEFADQVVPISFHISTDNFSPIIGGQVASSNFFLDDISIEEGQDSMATVTPTIPPTPTLTPTLTPALPTPATVLPLVAVDDTAATNEDTPIVINVLSNDSGGIGGSTIQTIGTPTSGTAQQSGQEILYSPTLDFFGTDTFAYTIQDAAGNVASAFVSITIYPVSDIPIANAQSITMAQNSIATISLTGNDADGDSLAFSISKAPENGSLSAISVIGANSALVTYTPNTNFFGNDNFVFQVNDGAGGVSEATVGITVNGIQQPIPTTAEFAATNTGPQIDGIIDDVWQSANSYTLSNIVLGESPITDSDLSATFRGLFDGSNIYLLIEVTDDSTQNDSLDRFGQDDVVEIYLDGNKSRGSEYDGVDDRQLIFRWNDTANHPGRFSAAVPQGIQREMVDTVDGYWLEISMPLTSLGIVPTDGYEFGLDVHVIDDDDGGDRDNKKAWHGVVDEAWRNPSFMGTGKLVGTVTVPTPTSTPIPPTATPTPAMPTVAEFMAVDNGPIIDGTIDSVWQTTFTYSLDRLVVGDPLISDSDLSAVFRGLFDSRYLYILVEVTDDILQNDSLTEVWLDDTIELYINGNNSQGSVYDGVDDSQFLFRWSDPTNYRGTHSIRVPSDTQRVIINSSNGYLMELALPLSALGITTESQEFGFDIHVVDDDDGGDRDNKINWHATNDDVWLDPSLMGTARLVGSGTTSPSGFQSVDSFESLGSGALNSQNGWRAATGVTVVVDPLNSTNQVIKIDGRDIYASKAFPSILPDSSVGTIHYRIMRDGTMDSFAGGTDESVPTEWDAFEVQFGTANEDPNNFRVRDQDDFRVIDQTFANQTWYCVWLTINNQTNTFEGYVQGGAYANRTQVSVDTQLTFGFRHGGNNPLQRFFARKGGQTDGLTYIDDIYIDSSQYNFASPTNRCE
ncbi:MAG: sugar-binding protein [Chloroflexota bacterium]